MAAHLLAEGINDRAAPASVFAADEHPVLVAKFGGADRVSSADDYLPVIASSSGYPNHASHPCFIE